MSHAAKLAEIAQDAHPDPLAQLLTCQLWRALANPRARELCDRARPLAERIPNLTPAEATRGWAPPRKQEE